ncbi:MAG: sugar phosphate nucleotidyltransferase, partial [Bdellovibrionota bacterium]
ADPECTSQLMRVFDEQGGSVVGVIEVPESEVSKYGIVSGKKISDRLMNVKSVIEKPATKDAPSRWAIPGRYVLTPAIFECLRNLKRNRGGEIQLTDALTALAAREKLFAYRFDGTRYDAGDRLGYLDATLAYAMKRKELAPGLRVIMKKHLGGVSK